MLYLAELVANMGASLLAVPVVVALYLWSGSEAVRRKYAGRLECQPTPNLDHTHHENDY